MPRRRVKRRTIRRRKKTVTFKLKESVTHEIAAIIYGCLAIISILSLQGSAGPIGETFRHYLVSAFGRGIWFFPFSLIIMSVSLFFSRKVNIHFTKLIGILLAFCSILGLMHMQTPFDNQLQNLENYGGYTGFSTAFLLRYLLMDTATTIILVGAFLIGLVIIFEVSLSQIVRFLNPAKLITFKVEPAKIAKQTVKIVKPNMKSEDNSSSKNKNSGEEKEIPVQKTKSKKQDLIINPPVKALAKSPKPLKSNLKNYPDWKLPSHDLLDDSSSKLKIDEKALLKKASQIKEKLNQFGIEVSMHDVNVGPTVTQYTLKPHEGVKLNKITSLKNDLALTLEAKSIRIQAPIPGRALVGIEIPNENRMVVHLREILESPEYQKLKSKMRLVFGRDVSGKSCVMDLEKMPHLLIAGRTGSGKSVCMNCFLISLLYQNSPQDLRFIMIDPKRVELMPYNGIPHLLTSVITDIDKALSALRWAVSEMSRRYTELSQKRYRNIQEYNEHETEKMNKIVIVVDELADLMMRNNKKEAELLICRLAQMARAVGIHLIIATQRPSVDVITGLIKANIPMRVAFAVASGIDSRTILDSIGAEDLLGLGDMLVETNSESGLVRVQGVLVSRHEIEKVTNQIKLTSDPEYDESIILGEEKDNDTTPTHLAGNMINLSDSDDEDDKFNEAVEVIRKTGKASATLLQRYLSIGYARAAKLLDAMEAKKMIGPAQGAKARKIYFLDSGPQEELATEEIEEFSEAA